MLALSPPSLVLALLSFRSLPNDTVQLSRELANQIFGVVSKFAVALDEAKPLLLVGGTSVEDCLASFRKGGASIIVGTPGRVEDMLNNYNVFDTRGEDGCTACFNLRTAHDISTDRSSSSSPPAFATGYAVDLHTQYRFKPGNLNCSSCGLDRSHPAT